MIKFFTYIRDRISVEDLLKVCGVSDNKTGRKKTECSICNSITNIHLCKLHGQEYMAVCRPLEGT
jgi:hypothetical protein